MKNLKTLRSLVPGILQSMIESGETPTIEEKQKESDKDDV
jgi:hypothetical protein